MQLVNTSHATGGMLRLSTIPAINNQNKSFAPSKAFSGQQILLIFQEHKETDYTSAMSTTSD